MSTEGVQCELQIICTQGNIERVKGIALERSSQRSAIRHSIALQILEQTVCKLKVS